MEHLELGIIKVTKGMIRSGIMGPLGWAKSILRKIDYIREGQGFVNVSNQHILSWHNRSIAKKRS